MKVIISKKKYDQLLTELTDQQKKIDDLKTYSNERNRIAKSYDAEPKTSAYQLKSIRLAEMQRVIYEFWKSMDGFKHDVRIQQFLGKFAFNLDHEHATLKENIPE